VNAEVAYLVLRHRPLAQRLEGRDELHVLARRGQVVGIAAVLRDGGAGRGENSGGDQPRSAKKPHLAKLTRLFGHRQRLWGRGAADVFYRAAPVSHLSAKPRRKLAVLTCMDARIEPLSLLGLEVGDAHVIRNAGGLVTDDALRSLSASQSMLGTEEIIVVMHEDCGMGGAPPEIGGFDDLEATLRDGIERLQTSGELTARGNVSGFVFDPRTGALRQLDAPQR
jgi:carbonic anhydrase